MDNEQSSYFQAHERGRSCEFWGLPECLGGLKKLYSLDLWSNDLGEFPDAISGMKALRFMDLRVIQFSQTEMDRITTLLPSVKIYFSQPCNCGE